MLVRECLCRRCFLFDVNLAYQTHADGHGDSAVGLFTALRDDLKVDIAGKTGKPSLFARGIESVRGGLHVILGSLVL